MASNENCYGPSPLAKEAAARMSSALHRYPEAYSDALRKELASSLNLDPEQIVPGNGSTELIERIAKVFLGPEKKCLTALETFPIYRMAVAEANAICEFVPLLDHRFDLEGMLQAIQSDVSLVVIANPNNPTGTALSREDLQQFLKRVPSNVIVVADEAYREYASIPVDSCGDVREHPNLIVLRTFSKVYGLAGLRLGYAICSKEVAEYLHRAAPPYLVNTIAQPVAIAGLKDSSYMVECQRKNSEQRERVQNEFLSRGYSFTPSHTNFILLKAQDPPAVCEGLLRKGILVAHVRSFHVPDGIRITLGTAEENDLMLEALSALL